MKTPISYLKEAWAIYSKKENFIYFSKVMAILVVVLTSFNYLVSYLYPDTIWEDFDYSNTPYLIGFIILSIISIILGLWVQSTTYTSVLEKPTDNIKSIYKKGFKNIWKYAFTSLSLAVIVILGTFLLIVPGIIFGVWFSFAVFLVLDRKMKVRQALLESKRLVKGKFFKVFGRSIVFVLTILLLQIAISAIPYVGYLVISFTIPLFILPFYLLYRDLVGADS